jgi:hypothetical protein
LSNSNHFPLNADSIFINPVALPPGRAKLATTPVSTGSMMLANTMGIARVCRCNSCIMGVAFPSTTSGFDATRGPNPVDASARDPTMFDPKIAPFRPTKIAQASRQSHKAGLPFWIVLAEAHHDAKPPHPLRLLSAHRERPRRCAR